MRDLDPTPALILFSAEQPYRSEAYNIESFHTVRADLDALAIPYKVVNGFFEGFDERTFVVPAEHIDLVYELCAEFDQDSFVLLDEQRVAFLIAAQGGGIQKQGAWVSSSVKPEGDYTYDPLLRTYYQAKWEG